jgi:hypothetical protein
MLELVKAIEKFSSLLLIKNVNFKENWGHYCNRYFQQFPTIFCEKMAFFLQNIFLHRCTLLAVFFSSKGQIFREKNLISYYRSLGQSIKILFKS